MKFFFLLISTISSIELILFIKFVEKFKYFLGLLKKNNKFFSLKKNSDHWKQKFILIIAFKVIRLGIILSTSIILIISPFLIINIFDKEFVNFIFSTFGIIEIIFISLIYILLRNKIVQKQI